MATSTTRLGLSKPAGSDVVDVAVLNANADKIDAAVGTVKCTSTTRPTTPYEGQAIYETDTKRTMTYINGVWEADVNATVVNPLVGVYTTARVANQAARDALFPSPAQFDAVFRKDLGYEETYLAAYNASTNPLGAATAGWYMYPQSPITRIVGSVVSNSTSSGVVKFVLPAVAQRVKLFGHVRINQTTSHAAGQTGVSFGFAATTGGVGTWTTQSGLSSYSMYPGGAALSNTMSVEFDIPVTAELTAGSTPDFRLQWTISVGGLSSGGPASGFTLDYYLEPFRA